jgi:hypothetical protein
MAEEDAEEDAVESEVLREILNRPPLVLPPRLPRHCRSTHGGTLWSNVGGGWWVNSGGGGWFGSGLPPGTVPEP